MPSWNNNQARQWLEERMLLGMKAGLDNIRELCCRLHHPQNSFQALHVVGTNGKGSTSLWIAEILRAHGYRTGLFTSPHLVSLRERIRCGPQAITETEVTQGLEQIYEVSQDLQLTYFEVMTALAFGWFKRQGVQIAVLEAGLGGRLDSTAVAQGNTVVLTSIGLDHTSILGTTTEQILQEKLGICAPGCQLFHGIQDKILQQQIEHYAQQNQIHAKQVENPYAGTISQIGSVYAWNAALAREACCHVLGASWQESLARDVFKRVVWPGRHQELRHASGKLCWILDGCHNAHAAQALAYTLEECYPGQRFTVLAAFLQDRDPMDVLNPLKPFIQRLILTCTQHPRMQNPVLNADIMRQQGWNVEVQADLSECLNDLSSQSLPVLVVGSLYLTGAVIHQLASDYDDLQWFRQFTQDDNERSLVSPDCTRDSDP